ncbi:MAG: glycosyltransferase family 2 protein [Ruminococcus sp.]
MKELISVIIPVYKVEEFLPRCVDSVISQTYKNLEIILVDDGSPDNCPQICDAYAKKDSRIKVVHKNNGGLSDARNAGLDIATGTLISFIDSDDWIDRKTYELIIKAMEETHSNIGACGYIKTTESNEKAVYDDSFSVLNAEQAIGATVENVTVGTVVWNKVYRREVLDGLQFRVGKYNEDEFFTFYALDKAQKIVYLHAKLYFYFQRSGSIMGNYSIKRLDMLDGVYERMVFTEKYYPNIALKTKISFCGCCVYHYQMLLRNKSVDNDNLGKEKVLNYRKGLKLKFREIEDVSTIEKMSLFLSNSSLGMKLICKIRNLIQYGV